MQHIDYKILPVRDDFLARARSEGIDDLGQPVERMFATGGEPCRDSFRRAEAGEALILASYCPFQHMPARIGNTARCSFSPKETPA